MNEPKTIELSDQKVNSPSQLISKLSAKRRLIASRSGLIYFQLLIIG